MKELKYQLRYDLPLWAIRVLTNWWPDNRITIHIRGALFSLFIGKCGKNLTVGRDVTLLAVHRLEIGNNVYLAKGTWLNAIGGVEIKDEVMFGPYVVLASSKHGFKNGSARFGGAHPAPVKIGRGSWLGAHAVVTEGVTIGSGNLIGANAVVTKNTPDNVFVAGVPARVIAERKDNPSEIRSKHG
jgi:acetyltransferase-like isoleucine patch superfamily enzyme